VRCAPALWFVCKAAVFAGIGCAVLSQDGSQALKDVDPILLQVYLGSVPVGDPITVFAWSGRSLVPLGELCRLLKLGISLDGGGKGASGFFISPKRRFLLDLTQRQVEVEGRKLTVPLDQIGVLGGEIFIDVRLLLSWFPLKVAIDPKAARVTLEPMERLPIQDAWDRDRKYGSVGGLASDLSDTPSGKRVEDPYQLAEVPMVDVNLSWGTLQHRNTPPVQGALGISGDLLWMSSNFYASRDAFGATRGVRETLFREDPNGGLLGPLQARRVVLGDFQQGLSFDLVGSLPQGRGISIDRYPISFRSRFAARTFQGELPEGWSVEFFQNDMLMAFQRSRGDGRYEFRDVLLRFGLNQFRLVFHGPFGEKRQETYRVDIASEQPPPGAFYYRIAGMEPNYQDITDPASLGVEDLRVLKHSACFAEADYGLTKWLSANAGFTRIALPTGYHNYSVAGLRGLFSYLSMQVEGAQDSTNGKTPGLAAETVLRTGYGFTSLTYKRAEYRRGFQRTDAFGFGGTPRELRGNTSVEASGSFHLRGTPMGMMLSRENLDYADGGNSVRDRFQLSENFRQWTFSEAIYRSVDGLSGQAALWEGSFMASSAFKDVWVQGELNLRKLDSRIEVSSLSLLTNFQHADWSYRLALKTQGTQLSGTTLLASANRLVGRFAYGSEFQYSKSAGYSISLRFQTSFGREPRKGRWRNDARPMAGQGAISAIAFFDENGNGVRDSGERVIEGTRCKIANTPLQENSEDPSVMCQTHLSRGQETLVQLDESSLEDPAQQATVKAFRVLPRSGHFTRIDFPISIFVEITGTTRLRRGGRVEAFGGLELELLDASGNRIKVLRTAFDGFFEIQDLPIGEYVLQVSAEEAARIGIKAPRPKRLRVDLHNNLYDGQDFVVEPLLEPDTPAPKPAPTPVPIPTASSPNLISTQ